VPAVYADNRVLQLCTFDTQFVHRNSQQYNDCTFFLYSWIKLTLKMINNARADGMRSFALYRVQLN
jgi:hypothetical protein